MHLSAFFDEPTTKNYRERVLSLYVATTSFLENVLNLETDVGPVLSYTPYYVYQMMVAAGCTLLKLCKSFFSSHIDMDYTKHLFNRTIWAIRGVSASSNDLPERLAEVLAQMWRLGGATHRSNNSTDLDDSLRLKVRCRMSMSLLFDSVWRWREDARTKGRNIEGIFSSQLNGYMMSNLFSSVLEKSDKPRLCRRFFGHFLCWPHTHIYNYAWYFRE